MSYIMKKRSREAPRMLPYVMQAITDLKDINGSTTRKILDQVHTAINISNVKPKPRNVVMQVKRALKHAVDIGVLKHKTGKYRLLLDLQRGNKDTGSKVRSRNVRVVRRRRRGKRSRRSPRRGRRRRRRRSDRLSRYSTSITSAASDRSYRTTTTDSYESEKKSRSKRRRRRSLAKKTVQLHHSVRRRRRKPRQRRMRQGTPMPKEIKGEEVQEMEATANKDTEELQEVFTNNNNGNESNDQGDNEAEPGGGDPPVAETPPECDNPDCLCNLKQEPCDDSNYEDNSGRTYFM